jgi:anaerobic glycerol-3-phosphate dehydrogenase
MPVSVKRLPDEPILIASLSGTITVDDIKSMYRQSSALMTPADDHIYRITDVRQATSTFAEMLKAIQESTQEMPGSAADSHVSVTFVGESTWVKYARDAFSRQGISMATFTDMESALDSIRAQTAQN